MEVESENELSLMPPDIQEATNIAPMNLLPSKSRKLYLSAYKSFVQWQLSKEITSFSESVLLVYFAELSTKYTPSTLWSNYSMLRSTLNLNHGINIDSYVKLKSYLKITSKGFQPKKARTFTPENINEFLTSAPDHKYLATKVAMIMGVMGACRANEMYRMKPDDLQDLGSALLVKALNTKTKLTRKFIITDDYYHICKKYISLRPLHAMPEVFFLNFQNGKCTSQRIGINKFTQMGRQVATYLQLPNPEKYSAHSFRRTSSILVEAGGEALKRLGGWKPAMAAKGCTDDVIRNTMKTAEKIANMMQQKVPCQRNAELLELSPESLYKRKLLCSDHFSPTDFCNSLRPVKLKKLAVPVAYDENRPYTSHSAIGSESKESQVIPNTTTDANICSPSTLTMVTSNRVVNDNIVIVVDDDENEIKTEIVDHDVKSDTDKIVDAAFVKKEPTDDPLYVGEIKTEPKEEEIVGNREVEHILEETTNNKHLEDTDNVKIKEEPEEIISNDANVVDKMSEVEQENCINTHEDSEMVQIPQLRQLVESTPFEESANVGIPSPVEITRRDIVRCDSSAQTDIEERELTIDSFLERNFQKNPSNFSEAVSRMFLIDEWVARLTKYRQDMLAQFKEPKERENNPESKSMNKKRKIDDDAMDAYLNDISAEAEGSNEEECIEEITMNDIDYSATKGITIEFEKVNDVIVEMKNYEDKLVAGSDSGKIYIFDQSDGKLLQQLELPTRVPITSLLLINEQFYTKNMYIGTFRDHLYVYNCHSYQFVKRITVNDSVLCMDDKWEYIFIGCAEGWLQRYSIEKGNIEFEEKFQEGNILSLKAAVEGPRRILIVATEDSPLCVRDAMTFLRLRLIASIESYVAQTINLNKNLIYCTTNDGQLLIMSFHKGAKVKSVKMPEAKGKHCTKFYRNLLFISRNSVVYLYDTKENQFIGNMKGPGGSIVSLNIIRNQLVIGTNKAEFTAIPIN